MSIRPLILGLLCLLVTACRLPLSMHAADSHVQTSEFLSQAYTIDKVYPSMRGPTSLEKIYLGEASARELLWIVGYETEVVDVETGKEISQEFMCHANLDLSPPLQRLQSLGPLKVNGRIFTLSQGQQKIDFPEGFGVPVMSHHPLELSTQVLNLNQPKYDGKIRHRVKLRYVRDGDLKVPMTALFLLGVEVLKVESGTQEQSAHFGFTNEESAPGPGCGISTNADPFQEMVLDQNGRPFIGHWYVQPGRERSRTEVTRRLALPHDLRVHYIAAHMHPMAESLELIDTTEMSQVFLARVQNRQQGLGIESVDHFSSSQGVPLYKSHQYSLLSVYDNKTDKAVDSMAVLYLYCSDPSFDLERFVQGDEEFCPIFPGAQEVYSSQGSHTVDIGWSSDQDFVKVKEFYGKELDWDGPHRVTDTSCYWVLGKPKVATLEQPVEPADGKSETALLWLWREADGPTEVLYSHWKPQ